jgi:hypothetical protein
MTVADINAESSSPRKGTKSVDTLDFETAEDATRWEDLTVPVVPLNRYLGRSRRLPVVALFWGATYPVHSEFGSYEIEPAEVMEHK